MTAQLKAVVVVFPGSNGDRDLGETFARVGFIVTYHPSNQPLPPDGCVVGFPGGFSYGDYWRAGVLASQAKAVQSLGDFVESGGLVIGICNGFQILVESGLLPGALTYNDPPGFRHHWITVEVQPNVIESPWFEGISPGIRWRMPMAHGEGNYAASEPEKLNRQVPLKYTQNPNGSWHDAAALLDSTGRVLGIMPHPERATDPDLGSIDGLALFTSAFRYAQRAR